MKRIILSLCLLLPMLAWADDSGTTGDCTWYFEETTGTLTVSGNGQMGNYYYWSKLPYDSYKDQIKNVVIEQGVTSIGNAAFYGCSNLVSITIPESVTSIGGSAISGCSSLNKIVIPNIKSWCGIEFEDRGSNPMFASDLEKHIYSDETTEIKDLIIPEGTNIIPDYAFYNCSSLTSISIPDGVKTIGDSAFKWCSSLASITIPVGVTSIGDGAFQYCSDLSSITIPEGVTSIGNNTFDGCSSLVSITIPEGVTTIGNSAFSWCPDLTSITLPESLTSISDYAFSGCSSLTSITIPEEVTIISDNAFSRCSSLVSITIPEGVTCIGDYTFYNCTSLASITIPESVTTIGNYTFQDCTSLTSITIPEGVTSIGYGAFSGCSSLASITIPEGVTTIGGSAFYNCTSLTSITIPESVTRIESDAFKNCSPSKIVIPNIQSWLRITFDDSYSNPMSNSLYGIHIYSDETTEIRDLVIPEGTTVIPNDAFSYCSSLTSVTIPEGVTSIGKNAFKGCSSLTSVTIPEGVTSIEDETFSFCYNLTSITIPESVTSISSSAFNYSNNIEIINFHNTSPIGMLYWPKSSIIVVPDNSINEYKAAWPDYANNIVGASSMDEVSVTVSAKENSSDLAEQIGENNLLNIFKLKLSGTINSYDMMILRNKMINLRELDMENVDIVANSYEYYTGCHSEDSVLGDRIFYNTNIKSVVLPKNIVTIGDFALSGSKLNNVTFTGNELKEIGSNAFAGTKISEITLPEGIEQLYNRVFSNCSNLKSLTLPQSLIYLGSDVFYGCDNLSEIVLPENITSLPSSTFSGCSQLSEIKMSPKTTSIGGRAFNNNYSLTEIKLPPYLQTIGDYAFSGCSNLKDIYAYMVDVPAISTNTFNDYQHQNLYVPEFLYNSYFYDTNWSQFLTVNVCDLKPGDYEAFYANSDVYFEPGVERITEDTPEVELGEHGGIIVEGEEQHFGDVHQNADGDGDSSSLIADGEDDGSDNNMPVNKLFVDMKVKANRWYFFCFPFDVTISECSYPGKYVWRHYDGAIRALQGSGGWQPVEGDKLEARHGYIFQSSEKGTLTIKFDHPTFGGKRPKELVPHASNNAANASWNFVGNPYSSYYEFLEDDFTAPITVWNGTSYEAFRPGDDDCHLQPYEAFFVQKPEAAEKINFEPERRETYWQIEKKKVNSVKSRQAKGINPDRLILNLTIGATEGENTDRMRLVLNEQASRNYELECDAAKFLSNDADAQIYAVEGENTLSINERPMDGDIRIGYVAKTEGTLRISSPRMDLPMMLIDNETGTSFDLSLGDYEFQTNAGTNNKRFILKPTGEATGIRTLTKETGVAIGLQDGGLNFGGAEGKAITIHTTSGALAAQHNGNGFVSLPSALYVVSVDGKSAKVYVK